MTQNELPCWLYKRIDDDIKSLIIKTMSDFDLMIEAGYCDNPRNCEPVPEDDNEPLVPKEIEEDSVSELHKEVVSEFDPKATPEELDLMTKEDLVAMANQIWGVTLKVRDTKVSLINEIKALQEG